MLVYACLRVFRAYVLREKETIEMPSLINTNFNTNILFSCAPLQAVRPYQGPKEIPVLAQPPGLHVQKV